MIGWAIQSPPRATVHFCQVDDSVELEADTQGVRTSCCFFVPLSQADGPRHPSLIQLEGEKTGKHLPKMWVVWGNTVAKTGLASQ
jgi:hypothetical protein